MNKIKQVINHIKSQTGLDVTEDSYFSGIQKHNDEIFFNIEIEKPVFISREFPALVSLSNKSSLIKKVQTGGYKRISIFLEV